CSLCLVHFFFFQAEDGIRDATVTGVQTCALPISAPTAERNRFAQELFTPLPDRYDRLAELLSFGQNGRWRREMVDHIVPAPGAQIGRASCRERGEMSVVEGGIRRKTKGDTAVTRE